MWVVNDAGDCRKRQDGLMGRPDECHPGDLDSIPAFATKYVCDTEQVTFGKFLTDGHFCMELKCIS